MQDILVVVDMQNDFVTGPLGTKEACEILPNVVQKMQSFDGMIFATRDTHGEDYPDTLEGKNLPVSHCIKGTSGWALCREVERRLTTPPLDKKSFGCVALGELLASNNKIIPITEVTLIGVCTDICVISNALLLKAFLPETRILVDASCCAGTSPEAHRAAFEAMKRCQIEIENE